MNISEAQNLVVKAGINLVESGLIARTWGNVSCRLDADHFLITPSGRDYRSLTPGDLVTVKIVNCSYRGNIKPSSEKGIHAEVYKLRPEANFVIHTHQDQASVISASNLTSMAVSASYPGLGKEVPVAAYALPGTKKLRRFVSQALAHSQGQAVIMKNHGALCFGKDCDEAFRIAHELENACRDFIIERYLSLSAGYPFDPVQMIDFALSLGGSVIASMGGIEKIHYSSRRANQGFVLYDEANPEAEIPAGRVNLNEEAALYDAIYKNYKKLNHIIFRRTPETLAVSMSGINLRSPLDDFAQIVGPEAPTVDNEPDQILKTLKKSPVVLVRGQGALCCGTDQDEAAAAAMVTQKACQAYIGALLFGRPRPINRLECILMHFVYQQTYSKKK